MKTLSIALLVLVVSTAYAWTDKSLVYFEAGRIETAARQALREKYPDIPAADLSFVRAVATLSSDGSVFITAKMALKGTEENKTIEEYGYEAKFVLEKTYEVHMDDSGNVQAFQEGHETVSKSISKSKTKDQQQIELTLKRLRRFKDAHSGRSD